MSTLISLFVTAAAIRIAGTITETLEVKDWVAAVLAAIAMSLLHMGIVALIGFGLGDPPGQLSGSWLLLAFGTWQGAVFGFVLNFICLTVAAAVVPGISIRGISGLIIAAVLLTCLDFATAFVLPQLWPRLGR